MSGLTQFRERFTEEERVILRPFFTNSDKGVFALTNLPEETKGALFARYSRSSKSMRRLFLDEFIRDPATKEVYEGLQEALDALSVLSKHRIGGKRASKFFASVIAQYGDDSVIDVGSAHLAIEGVDQLEAKFIEDGRLAGYIEKSTRYVDFTKQQKLDNEGFIVGEAAEGETGHYLYKEYPEVQASTLGSQYTNTMDLLFQTVRAMQGPVVKVLTEQIPLDEQTFEIVVGDEKQKVRFDKIRSLQGIDVEKEEQKARRAYETATKAKAFDLTRGALPASTVTNIGWHASFRSFEHSLLKMMAEEYPPILVTARDCFKQLMRVSPALIERVNSKHGHDQINFMRAQRRNLKRLAAKVEKRYEGGFGFREPMSRATESGVTLVHFDGDAPRKISAASLFPYSGRRLNQMTESISQDELYVPITGYQDDIIEAATKGSLNRRYKPPRSFELARYTFDMVGNFAIFRDLQRNRFTLQVRQELTTRHGYDRPQAIVDAGMESNFKDAMEASKSLHADLLKKLPKYAEAATTFAHRLRWMATMDLRQAVWMLQLRTGQQGHPDYRNLMQKAYMEMLRVHPGLVNKKTMPHVDLKEHQLERLAAAHKTEGKLEALARTEVVAK